MNAAFVLNILKGPHWFTFETRIRQIVDDLLRESTETVKKMMVRQEEVEETISLNKRRIDEHDFLLYKF